MFQINGKYLRRLSFEIGYLAGQEEGGIVHPSEINCHLHVSRLGKYHRKRLAMLKS